MRTTLLSCLGAICLAGSTTVAFASSDWSGSPDRGFGAGVMLGEPTGVNLKYWIGERSAVDGVVGWSFEGKDNLHLHASYLYHVFDLVDLNRDQFAVYFGGGLRYKLVNHRSDWFGIRGVGGIAYLFDNIPVDVFFELGPVLDLTPKTRMRFGAAVGARFWF